MGEKRVFRAPEPEAAAAFEEAADGAQKEVAEKKGWFKRREKKQDVPDAQADGAVFDVPDPQPPQAEEAAPKQPPQESPAPAPGPFEVSEVAIRVNRATHAGKRRLLDIEREVRAEDPFGELEPLAASELPAEDLRPRRTKEAPKNDGEPGKKKKFSAAEKKAAGTRRAPKRKSKKAEAKKTGLLAWLRASRKNLVLGICGAVAVLALIAGVTAISVIAIRNQAGAETPDDVYVETLDVNVDDYAGVLLERTDDAGEKYLKETLFVGDSNTARLSMYGLLTLDNVIGIESMGAEDVTEWNSVYFSGYNNPVKVPEAVAMMKPRRIILNFGTNDLIKDDADAFIKEYAKALDAIVAAYPYSDVIISAIPPLGSNRSNQKLTMEIVDAYNLALLDFAKERGLTFLNISETLKGSDGWMRTDYVIEDGIHMSKTAMEALLRYVRTHSHIVDDAREKPLGDIPARRPAPVIETDEPELSPDTVVGLAYGMFASAGFGRIESGDDMSNAVRLDYAIPLETAAGEEQNVANNFYNFVIKQLSYKNGKVSLSGAKNASTYNFYATIIPVLCDTHTYGEPKVKAATCVTDGLKTYTCTVCGYETTEVIPALGHDYLEITENKTDPTCTEAGQRVYVCQRTTCTESTKGHVKTEVVPALGHSPAGAVTQTTAPTCTAEGAGTQLCSRCNQTVAVKIPALGHDYITSVTTPAGCTTEGTATYTCSRGDDSYTAAIPATGHAWVSDGNGNDTCSNCGATQPTPGYVPPTEP